MTIRLWGITLIAVFVGWVITIATVMVATDAAPGAIVVLPRGDFVAQLPDGAAVVAKGVGWIAIKSDTPGLGRALYHAGGSLVLPAGLPGCLPLPVL